MEYSRAGPLHDLVQPPVVCGDGGAAPWGPGMYLSLGRWDTWDHLVYESPIAFRCWGGAACSRTRWLTCW